VPALAAVVANASVLIASKNMLPSLSIICIQPILIGTEKIAPDKFRLFIPVTLKHHKQPVIQIIADSSDQQSKAATFDVMHLASLNVDTLLYLMKFIDPVDRFNLVLSGILKGLENVSREINLKKRYFNHSYILFYN
jgi:hypothetical protein